MGPGPGLCALRRAVAYAPQALRSPSLLREGPRRPAADQGA